MVVFFMSLIAIASAQSAFLFELEGKSPSGTRCVLRVLEATPQRLKVQVTSMRHGSHRPKELYVYPNPQMPHHFQSNANETSDQLLVILPASSTDPREASEFRYTWNDHGHSHPLNCSQLKVVQSSSR